MSIRILSCVVVTFALTMGWLARADDAGKQPTTKPYALDVCLVSGEKLGEMGAPIVIQYEGREIRFCCASCEKPFRKDPAKFLKKLDEAEKAAATQPTTAPAH